MIYNWGPDALLEKERNMKMRSIAGLTGGLLLAVVLTAPATAQEGAGERLGERLDQAVDTLQQEAKELAGQARRGFERVRGMVEQMSVEARVLARIRWDKALQGASVSVDVDREGTAVLSGTVRDETALAKAQQLAGDTIGVQRAVNKLTVLKD